MNKNVKSNDDDDDKFIGDPQIGIERAEDEETPKETHPARRDESRPE